MIFVTGNTELVDIDSRKYVGYSRFQRRFSDLLVELGKYFKLVKKYLKN